MKALFKKRIPMILGIIFILLTIPLTIFFIKNQTTLKSKASDSQKPLDMRVTNISDRSMTITYRTELPSTGSINYGSDKKLGESELEDIDREKGSFSPKKIHSISVKKLMPSTKYYLVIVSGSNTFLDNGVPFEAITGSDISSLSAKSDLTSAKQKIIKGKIVLPNRDVPSEALVYLNAEDSQSLSGTVAKDGTFSFSLKELRTDNLSSYFKISENTIFKIVATDGTLKSTVLTSLNQADSLPTITLSNDYDFVQAISPTASNSAKSSGFPLITPSKKIGKPQIINPKQDQSFRSQKPQFHGTSLPNEKVEIIIHSNEQITAQIFADSNGNWTYQPQANLSPGAHTITIKTRDSSGILTIITQSFTVFADDSQASTAVPSVIPTQAVTPIQAPISTLFPSPTIPVLISLPTITPTPSPIILPIESKGGLPPTGDSRIIFVVIAATAATIIGIALHLLTQRMPL